MRQGLLCILLACGELLFFTWSAAGQEAETISGDFTGIKFNEFIRKMETTSHYHFYYDPALLDTLRVNARAAQTPLSDLLEQVLKPTIFHFAIDLQKNVFIVNRRIVIQPRLPEDFFDITKKILDTSGQLATKISQEEESRAKLNSSLENKLFQIGTPNNNSKQVSATLAGYVRDNKNGEAIVGASVYLDGSSTGVITDQFGYFALTLSPGRYKLRITGVGMKETKREIMLYSDGKLNIELQDDIPTLKAVVVAAEKSSNIKRLQMGVERLNIKSIKKIPVLLGEADILRVVLTLPGVTSVGEASTGFNVRGGSADQNLVLYNGATVYNPSHFFGFFTAFNPDVVKGVELYKSSLPEKYGGRLSSVLDITTREGNTKKLAGTGGIGPLTSKFTIEGPIVKDKTSFIAGGRTTYANWILKNIRSVDFRNSKASFYDLDFHVNHTINSGNNLYLSWYLSNDQFKLHNDTLYKYGNRNITLQWKHIFNNKMYVAFTGGLDHYQYAVASDQGSVNGYELTFKIKQLNLRSDFSYAPNNSHNLNFGATSIFYKINPGSYQPKGLRSLVARDVVAAEQALENAFYLGDKYSITDRLSLSAGVRYSFFHSLGPQRVYSYIPGLPRDPSTFKDSSDYSSGKIYNTYHGPELRMALRYSFSPNASVKLSYNILRQYIHLLSNTSSISPTDIWKLSGPNIKPQLGDQVSLGFYKNFKSNSIETSVEFYYKRMRNYLDYKSGASLILNHHIETDAITTRGKAYGAEFLFKKVTGKLNGWMSYTWSRTMLRMDDPVGGQVINEGKYYPANFDKPHNVNLVGNYRFSHRYSISLNGLYSTGRPITLPIAIFNYAGSQRVYYSNRNQYRVPDYFRIDLSVNMEGNHKVKQRIHNSWSFGVYNLTGRKNPYSIYFTEENGIIKGYKLSVIGVAIPFLTYNFRF